MFHIYRKINDNDIGYSYMVIDDTSLTFDYLEDLTYPYRPNSIKDYALTFKTFLDYLGTQEYFFDDFSFMLKVPSLDDLQHSYPELFI